MMELWPFTNFHDLNLDWLIRKWMKLESNLEDIHQSMINAENSAEAAAESENNAAVSETNAANSAALAGGYAESAATMANFTADDDIEWYSTLAAVNAEGYINQGMCYDSTRNVYIIGCYTNLSLTYENALIVLDSNYNHIRTVKLDGLGHANDLTYNPDDDLIIVAPSSNIPQTVIALDPVTLQIVEQYTLPITAGRIAYDTTLQCYYVNIATNDNTFYKFSRGFAQLDTFTIPDVNEHAHATSQDLVTWQGLECFNDVLYLSIAIDRNYNVSAKPYQTTSAVVAFTPEGILYGAYINDDFRGETTGIIANEKMVYTCHYNRNIFMRRWPLQGAKASGNGGKAFAQGGQLRTGMDINDLVQPGRYWTLSSAISNSLLNKPVLASFDYGIEIITEATANGVRQIINEVFPVPAKASRSWHRVAYLNSNGEFTYSVWSQDNTQTLGQYTKTAGTGAVFTVTGDGSGELASMMLIVSGHATTYNAAFLISGYGSGDSRYKVVDLLSSGGTVSVSGRVITITFPNTSETDIMYNVINLGGSHHWTVATS